ncbi:MAG TPA: cell division protein ZapA [Lachnospiraceae bacterium]|nr:cell division protein ZapA [Lachnospiraceae bacterium]
MEKKNVTEVVIGGKIYKLGGYESEDYLHQVASYLNNRITELKSLDGYHRLPTAQKSLMLDLNTADDYFKAKRQVEKLEADLSDKDRELYEIRHELVSAQVKLEENQKLITSLREEADDYLKRIALLEARVSHQDDQDKNPEKETAGRKEKR